MAASIPPLRHRKRSCHIAEVLIYVAITCGILAAYCGLMYLIVMAR